MNRIDGAFEHFDPLSEKPQNDLIFAVGYLYQRAMKLLPKTLTINDLNAGLELITQMVVLGEHKIYSCGEVDSYDDEPVFHTMSFTLFSTKDHFSLPTNNSGHQFAWSNIFAIATLANVANYIELDREIKLSEDDICLSGGIAKHMLKTNQSIQNQLPLEAMEAIGYAEALYSREQTKTRQAIAKSKTTLGNYHDLKVAIITTYLGLYGTMSDRQIAIRAHDNLPTNLRNKSMASDPIQQIQNWISQYRKGTIAGIELLPPNK
jgi:hypothetical protein